MQPGELVAVGGPGASALAVIDEDGWWKVERTDQPTGDGRVWYRAVEPMTEDEAVALIEAAFPGTSPEPVETDDTSVDRLHTVIVEMLGHYAAKDPARLAAAGRAMYEHFAATEPERMNRPGWRQYAEALAPFPAPVIDPEETGGVTGTDHPATSRKAAETVNTGTQMHGLLSIVVRSGREGVTCFEAAQSNLWSRLRPGISPNQLGARMLDLRARHLVMKADDGGVIRERPAAGGSAEVYVATDKGREELTRLGAP